MSMVFEHEWRIWKQLSSADRTSFTADKNKKDSAIPFDGEVKVGEIRIFADMKRPFVALIIENRGLAGWEIVPISPFTVPASRREMLVGERVLQLWNACVAAKSFVERSWLVDTLDEADMADVKAALSAVAPGCISAGFGSIARYEREFLMSGGRFQPIVEKKIKAKIIPWRSYGAWRIAAMFIICLGMTWLVYHKHNEAILYTLEPESAPCPVKASDEPHGPKEDVPLSLPATVVKVETKVPEAPPPPATPSKGSEPMPESAKVVSKSVGDAMAEARLMSERLERMRCEARDIRENRVKERSYADSTYSSRLLLGGNDINHRGRGRAANCMTKGLQRRQECVPQIPMWQDHGTERYAEFNENEFLSPKSNPLSTFSLDVDTSSYTMMRRYITEHKRLPPNNSVRIEEYVNYFRYDYAQPTNGDPIAVNCELAECPWNKSHKLLRLGVQARKLEGDSLPPCNLTFLVDRSGSMGHNNGMNLLKSGLKMLVGKLRDEDHVSIVAYADGTEVLLKSTPGSEKAKITRAIDSLVAQGCTAGGSGIQLAYEEAVRNFDKKANNRVILVTDGDFNVGISSPKELENFIAKKRSSGIFLSVIGVGYGNYQDAKMKKLANAGNGNYAYVDSLLEAKKVMMTEFGGTLFTVAKDVKVQVEFNPAQVESYRLLGYENRKLEAKDFNDDKKDAGEMGSGHTMTAFYEIVPAGAKEEAGGTVDPLKYQKTTSVESVELFTVKMRWKEPDGQKSKLKEIAWRAADITHPEPSEDFRFASAVAEFALLLEDSKFKGKASFGDVFTRAHGAKGRDKEGYRAEFIRLVEAAELMKADKKAMNDGEDKE